MKIALVGYGKMGKAIEKIAVERGHEIVARLISKDSISDLSNIKVDAAIEFTVPDVAFNNLSSLAQLAIPTVCGTTGWLNRREEIESAFSANSSFLYASNFSVGVNLFFKLNSMLAKLMAPHSAYKVSMEEIHHTQKLDAPSGTAISLAEDLIAEHPSYQNWELDKASDLENFAIVAKREPEVPGTHVVEYTSEIDEISIKHEAFNRTGFALGAVMAAEFICDKRGVFSMNDVLNI